MVVAAYGLILPLAVLTIPPRGCLNIHASLLPRWRGAAPIQRALLAGDEHSGVTIMQMDEGLDTGPVLLEESIPIGLDDTAQTLHDRLAAIGAQAIVRALRENPPARPQDAARATYAAKIDKSEATIDWARDAADICRQVRAFNPAPGAATTWLGAALKIWRATPISSGPATPGTVLRSEGDGIRVAAGHDAVVITELQKAGGKRLTADRFLLGTTLSAGTRLGT
ncbi:MAG: methionyl-tRNA formyltransferase [Betaproteobacteria bacterium]|nr:methionyl-tRNA formyltransferase [Betaproteobacteria bacterium]